MLHDFTNRPLAGSLRARHDRLGHRVQEPVENGGGLAQHKYRVIVAKQVEKAGNVGRNIARGGRSGIAEDAHGGSFRLMWRPGFQLQAVSGSVASCASAAPFKAARLSAVQK